MTEEAPAVGEAATQELLIGARARPSQRLPPGALGGGVLAEAEVELALDRVPAGIAGGDVFRDHGGQAVEPGLRAVQVGQGDGAPVIAAGVSQEFGRFSASLVLL